MKKILIISTSLEEQDLIEEVAQQHSPGGFEIETTASFGQDLSFWLASPPEILVVNLPDDDLLQGYYFTKLRRDVQTSQAVIFLCSQISAPLMQLSTHFSKVRIVKTPAGSFTLYRHVVDLAQEYGDGKQQIHPRYMTDQVIEVSSDFRDGKTEATMKNLSKGGIYFEAKESDFKLAAGDLAKVSILLGNPSKQYVFDIKIVWARPQPNGEIGYGVAFIEKEEVYNNLLKNI